MEKQQQWNLWFFLVAFSLLLLTFLLGTGSAVSIPAWQATTSDAVPRGALGAARNRNASHWPASSSSASWSRKTARS